MLMYTTDSPDNNTDSNKPSFLLLIISLIGLASVSAFLGLGLGLVIETESFRELIGNADFFVFLLFSLAVWGVNYVALESVTTSGGKQLTVFSFLLMAVAIAAFAVQIDVIVKPVLYYYGAGAVLLIAFLYTIKAVMGERQQQ